MRFKLILFQSAPPGWGAINPKACLKAMLLFQSAPPGWGAIMWEGKLIAAALVSIRAPRVGGDL